MSVINRTLAAAPGSYATAAEVRRVSGLTTNDISDADLNQRILDATVRFMADATERMDGVVLSADSTRKVFRVPAYAGLVADADADGDVDAADVRLRFLYENADGTITEAATGTVTVSSSEFGVFTTQNALPDGYEAVADYRRYYRLLDFQQAKRAVAYLSAHFAYLQAKRPGGITVADLQGIGSWRRGSGPPFEAWMQQRTVWLDEYRRELDRITGATMF